MTAQRVGAEGQAILAMTAATVRSQRTPANWNVSRTAAPMRAVMWLPSNARARWRRVFTVSALMSRQAAVSALLRPSTLRKHEDRAVDLWQRIHGVLDGLAELVVSRALLRASGSRCKRRHALLEVGLPASPAPTRRRLVHGDPREPRREPCPASELVEVLEGAHERVLGYVLGLPLVPHDGPCDTVKPLVVAAREKFEEGGLAR